MLQQAHASPSRHARQGTRTHRWLLTGATGRVGRLVTALWRAQPPEGVEVVIQSWRGGDGADLVWAPSSGPQALLDEVDRNGAFDTMLVLAGTTPATGTDMELNPTLGLACTRAAVAAGIGRVLLASSSAVYGRGNGQPIDEHSPTAPVGEYGASKLRMETQLRPYFNTGLDLCALRIGNVAGADALLYNARTGAADAPILIDRFADGRGPQRSYIGPASLARVLETLARLPMPLPPLLNVAAAPVRMEDLAAATGRSWSYRPAPPSACQSILLDTAILQSFHRFDPDEQTPAAMIAQCRAAGFPL